MCLPKAVDAGSLEARLFGIQRNAPLRQIEFSPKSRCADFQRGHCFAGFVEGNRAKGLGEDARYAGRGGGADPTYDSGFLVRLSGSCEGLPVKLDGGDSRVFLFFA